MLAQAPPSFLKTTLGLTDRILSRTTFFYECKEDNKMLPFVNDLDSNYKFEVECGRDGQITKPTWPYSCDVEETCINPSDPPSATIQLQRIDSRAK